MKANKNDINKCGIYCIRNMVNNKVYIGKSKNIYNRIIQHCHKLKIKDLNENPFLIKSWHKYGRSSFEYFVIEYLELNEKLVAERELYWMQKFNSLNKNYGYNLRCDSESKMIVHESTSKKISERLKKEWAEGIRSGHSKKVSKAWTSNSERMRLQSIEWSKKLTKYFYNIYTLDNILLETCNYKRLRELHLQNVMEKFHTKKVNIVKFKEFIIEKIIIKDIV